MKLILFIFILATISCNNQQKQTDNTINVNSSNQTSTIHKSENSEHYTTKDTILIVFLRNVSLRFSINEYNMIIDEHPEFFREYPSNPDHLYYNVNDSEEFAYQTGQDSYYILYAYFLKKKNGINTYAEQRKKLIDIYSNINSLYGHIKYGGTYFAHQIPRILGYAEYSITLLQKKDRNVFEKTYDITKQKNLYIKSLRQLIDDESLNDKRITRTIKLNKIVDELDSLITDNFYLRRTQKFHYEKYDYH
jgi:hypothetical protein